MKMLTDEDIRECISRAVSLGTDSLAPVILKVLLNEKREEINRDNKQLLHG